MQINSSSMGVVNVCRSRGAGSTHVDVYTIHEVRPSACRSKQLLYESDRSSCSISELSLSYSSTLFYGSIGTKGVSHVDSESGVVEPYRYVPDHSNSPSLYASHDPNDHEGKERLANDW